MNIKFHLKIIYLPVFFALLLAGCNNSKKTSVKPEIRTQQADDMSPADLARRLEEQGDQAGRDEEARREQQTDTLRRQEEARRQQERLRLHEVLEETQRRLEINMAERRRIAERARIKEDLENLRREIDEELEHNNRQIEEELQARQNTIQARLDAMTDEELLHPCHIPGPNDRFNRADLRSIEHFPEDRFLYRENFIAAIEAKCREYIGEANLPRDQNLADFRKDLIDRVNINNNIFTLATEQRLINRAENNIDRAFILHGHMDHPAIRFDTVRNNPLKAYLEAGFLTDHRFHQVGGLRYLVDGRRQDGLDGGGLTRDFLDRISGNFKNLYNSVTGEMTLRVPNHNDANDENPFIGFYACISAADNLEYFGNIEAKGRKCYENFGAIVAKLSFIEHYFRDQRVGQNLPLGVPNIELSPYILNRLIGKRFENIEDWLAITKLIVADEQAHPFNTAMATLKIPGNNIEDLYLNFADFGGNDIDVTEENLLEYLVQKNRHFLETPNTTAFINGFQSIIEPTTGFLDTNINAKQLSIILHPPASPEEFARVLRLRANNNPINYVDWMVEIVNEELQEDPLFLKNLLHFWTGSSALPATRLKISIQNNWNNDRLPKSYTCFNRLDIPRYNSKEIFKEKLKISVKYGGGFALE